MINSLTMHLLTSFLLYFILFFSNTKNISAAGNDLDPTLPTFEPKMALPSFKELGETVPALPVDNTNSNPGTSVDPMSSGNTTMVVTFKNETPSVEEGASDHISVDFVNEDIKQVLRYVAEMYDLNIIIPTALQGNVTIRLKDATWESLLESILGPISCAYTKNGNIIQICSIDTLSKEPLKTETFLLKFADAKQITEELKEFVDTSNGGKITFNERSNVLIITERSKNLQTLASIVELLDKPETQVMIEAKFVEASSNSGHNIGFKWPSALSAYLSDKKETSNADGEGGNNSSTNEDIQGQIVRNLNHSKFFKPQSITISSLTAGFNLSQTENIGKTLSNPTIITMNNVPATMSVVENYPVPNYTYNTEQGSYEISGFEEKPIGIELKVTPKVQAEYITLKIEPSLSSNTGTVTFTSSAGSNVTSSINYPKISQKKTDSIVTIKSGYTIAIGGLMSQSKKNNVTKTPFLGDIPILGKLFSQTEISDDVSNLLIFLSATQIGYDGTLLYPYVKEVQNISQKKMFNMELTNNDLPGDNFSDAEQQTFKEAQALKLELENVIEKQRMNEAILRTQNLLLRKNLTQSNDTKTENKQQRSKKQPHKKRSFFKKHNTYNYITQPSLNRASKS